jgi:hypothetical protein
MITFSYMKIADHGKQLPIPYSIGVIQVLDIGH